LLAFAPEPGGPAARGPEPTAEPGHAQALAAAVGSAKRVPLVGPADGEEQRWVEHTLGRLTLEQRVGQMFMGFVFGTSAEDADPLVATANHRVSGVDTAAQAVRRYGLGGVIYFDVGGSGPGSLPDNIVDTGQLRRLSGDIQGVADVPLLVATDQEHGPVTRIRNGVTLLPGQMALGAGGNSVDVHDAAQVTGADLLALGINVNFAPDTDVNTNPTNPVIAERSFGDDPAAVSRLTTAAVEGYAEAGVAATAKHFPGHGSTAVDSHVGLPVVSHTREQLDTVDLPPFRAAIAAGVPMVMVGHLLVPALDPKEPASLSQPVVNTLLRHKLGFQGVIVTDALNMAAVTQKYSPGETAVRAVLAGNDLLLMPPQLVEATSAVLAAVRDGRIRPGRIDESVRRLLHLKWRLAHTPPRRPGNPATIATRVASRSVTLLDMACGGTLPLGAGATADVVGPASAAGSLRTALAARGIGAAPAGSPGDIRIELARSGTGGPAAPGTVVVSTGAPYRPPVGAAAWFATYSADPTSMAGLAAVLTGASAPLGRLPVATSLADGRRLPRGSGLPKLATC
jgi:beta-N-acetylhexosaminidase